MDLLQGQGLQFLTTKNKFLIYNNIIILSYIILGKLTTYLRLGFNVPTSGANYNIVWRCEI